MKARPETSRNDGPRVDVSRESVQGLVEDLRGVVCGELDRSPLASSLQ